MANSFCTCPADCTTQVMYTALHADPNCILPASYHKAQITDIVIKPNLATAPTAVTSAAFDVMIDNAITDNTKGKHFTVEGGIAAATKTTLDLPKGKSIDVNKRFPMTLIVKDMSDAMFNFLKLVECGNLSFTFWFADEKYSYPNSVTGIEPSSVSVDFPRENNKDAYAQAVINLTFDACGFPSRVLRVF